MVGCVNASFKLRSSQSGPPTPPLPLWWLASLYSVESLRDDSLDQRPASDDAARRTPTTGSTFAPPPIFRCFFSFKRCRCDDRSSSTIFFSFCRLKGIGCAS